MWCKFANCLLLLQWVVLPMVAQEALQLCTSHPPQWCWVVGGEGSSYQWWTEGAEVVERDNNRILLQWSQSGRYVIKVLETNAEGCHGDTVYATVWVRDAGLAGCEEILEVPNLFTPNGDQLNDLFRIRCLGVPEQFSLRILNRWGSTVFHSTSPDQSWDGTHNGQPCAEGTYFYLIQFTHGQRPGARNGVLQLLR